MSRRHHGRPHHGRHRNDGPRPDATANRPVAPAPIETAPSDPVTSAPRPPAPEPAVERPVAPATSQPMSASQPGPPPVAPAPATAPVATNGSGGHVPTPAIHVNGNGAAETGPRNDRPNGCTAPQLRRFIKSRPYVPMHELRRRFAIDGTDDDVTQVELDGGHVYVGLPSREGSLLGELLRGGEIGYELSFDPLAPIVVGVYPMRPVPRT